MIKSLKNVITFTVCFVALNPIFYTFGIRGSVLLLVLFFLGVLSIRRVVVSQKQVIVIFLGFLFLATCAVTSLYNKNTAPVIYGSFFLLTVFSVMQTSYHKAVHFVEYASNMMHVLIIFAIIGSVYYYAGGGPLISLFNPDGRENLLYLTTFSNASEFFIRPSGIYDEPGAFSFYICFTVALRSILLMSYRRSALLLLGGIITLSIAHVIFCLIWFAWVLLSERSRLINLRGMLAISVFFVVVGVIYGSGSLEWTLSRAIDFYENPWMNPRHRAFDDVSTALNGSVSSYLFGFDPDCISRNEKCLDFGENPLTPLVYGGLMASWPYYAFLVLSALSLFWTQKGLIYVAISILFLQRPYLLEFPYSALFALLLIFIVSEPMASSYNKTRKTRFFKLPV